MTSTVKTLALVVSALALLFAAPLARAEAAETDSVQESGSSLSVTAFGANGDDSADDTAAIQAAVNACGSGGGTVGFPSGTYVVSKPIRLPAGNREQLVLSGYGARIKLTATTPRFLVWNRTALHQTFRKFAVEGFTVDAGNQHPASGSYSVLGFDMASGGIYDSAYLNIEEVTVRDCTVKNVATSARSAWNPCVINVYTTQWRGGEPAWNHITDVTVENCRLEGGSRGVNITANGPYPLSVSLDRIAIRDCWHDTGIDPVSFSASTNYHIGQSGRVGTIELTNNYGARAFDCGIEIDQPAQGLIENCVVENSYYNEYYYTNFNRPLSGAGQTTFRNCTANVTRSVYGGTGFTIGWEGTKIGVVELDGFTANLDHGTKVTWQVNSDVVLEGLYVDGVKASLRRWAYDVPSASSSETAAAAGTTTSVKRIATLGRPRSAGAVSRGQRFTVWGTLKPRVKAGSKTVKLNLYRYTSGNWRYVKTYSTVNANCGSYSKYQTKIRLWNRGTYRFKAIRPESASWARSTSTRSYTISVR